MTEEQWLQRLDEHMARGNEIMRRSDETMRRMEATEGDLTRFIRDQNTRMERVVQRFERRMDDIGDQLRANTAATWAMVDAIRGRG